MVSEVEIWVGMVYNIIKVVNNLHFGVKSGKAKGW